MNLNTAGSSFQPVMKAEEKAGKDLYTQVAKYCHEQIIRDAGMKDIGLCTDLVERNSKIAAKISFDFADAFMRELYERLSVTASMQSPSISDRVLKGNTTS